MGELLVAVNDNQLLQWRQKLWIKLTGRTPTLMGSTPLAPRAQNKSVQLSDSRDTILQTSACEATTLPMRPLRV